MNTEMNTIKAACAGVTVLLVDSYTTCLIIISKMLQILGYKVIVARRAADAFCILRDRGSEIDVILADTFLPDIDKYELLETLKKISKHPVALMSANHDENAMLGGLSKGAMVYFVKPITKDDLKYLWQFEMMKESENLQVTMEGTSDVEEESSLVVNASAGVDVETQPLRNEERPENLQKGKEKLSDEMQNIEEGNNSNSAAQPLINEERQENFQKGKRKISDEMQNNEEGNIGNSAAQKKSKLVWTHELHNRFLQAIRVLGMNEAHPKKILDYMNVPGLKKVNVSSHLQKYRLSLKRQHESILKDMMNGTVLFHSLPVLSPFSPQQGFNLFPNMQSMRAANQLGSSGQLQGNLSGCVPIPSPGFASLPRQVDSNRNDLSSTVNLEQQTPCIEQPHSGYQWTQIGEAVTEDGDLVGLHQMGDSEQCPKRGQTDVLKNGDNGLESLLQWPTPSDGSLLEKEQLYALLEPLQLTPTPQDQQVNDNSGAHDYTLREAGGNETSELFNEDDFAFLSW